MFKGIKDGLRRWLLKEAGISFIPGSSAGASWPSYNYRQFAVGAYSGNELVYAGITRIVRALGESPLRVVKQEDHSPLPKHPLQMVLNRPNRFTSQYRLKEQLICHLFFAGTAFIEKVRNTTGSRIRELWPLEPDRVKIEIAPNGLPQAYIYMVAGKEYRMPPSDIIHIRTFNPDDQWFGIPILKAALKRIETDTEQTDFVKTLFQNSAVPGIMVKVDQPVTDQKARDRFRAEWQNAFGGSKRGSVFLCSGTEGIEKVGLNMDELAFPELTTLQAVRICTVLGVSPYVLGVVSDPTYANYEVARRAFWEDTIEPLQNLLDDELEAQLALEFGNDIGIVFDNGRVSAFRDARRQVFLDSQQAVTSGWMSVNEARLRSGIPEVPGGDVFLRGLATRPVPTGEVSKGIKSDVPRGIKADRRIALIAHAIGRRNRGELWLDKLKDAAALEFRRQAKDVQEIIREAVVPKAGIDIQRVLSALQGLEPSWTKRTIDELMPLLMTIITEAGAGAAEEIGISFSLSNEATEAFVRDYAYKFAYGISKTSVEDVRAIVMRSQTEGLSLREMSNALLEKFDGWQRLRADMVARTETIRAANQGAEEGWRQGGIPEKEWLCAGDACDFCLEMNGKVISIGANFHEQGGSMTVGERTLNFNYEAVAGPPAHVNCRCTLLPVVEE